MSKPAPTPWGLLPYDTTVIHQGYGITDANGNVIASIRSELAFDSIEQLEATARLIVSAPELLEKLKDVLDLLEVDGYSAHRTDGIRQLIAKVEG